MGAVEIPKIPLPADLAKIESEIHSKFAGATVKQTITSRSAKIDRRPGATRDFTGLDEKGYYWRNGHVVHALTRAQLDSLEGGSTIQIEGRNYAKDAGGDYFEVKTESTPRPAPMQPFPRLAVDEQLAPPSLESIKANLTPGLQIIARSDCENIASDILLAQPDDIREYTAELFDRIFGPKQI